MSTAVELEKPTKYPRKSQAILAGIQGFCERISYQIIRIMPQDTDLKDIITKLIPICAEDEVAIVGMTTAEQMVNVCLSNRETSIRDFSMPQYGHNIDIAETIIYIYAMIKALDTTLSLIEKLERRGMNQSVLISSAKEMLQQTYKISEEKWEKIQDVLINWLSKIDK